MHEPAKRGKRAWSLIVAGVALVTAVALQGINFLREAPKSRSPHLSQSVPLELPGWSGRDVPLGANEFLSNEVEKVLNYDDVLYREYGRGGENFGVYVAYWGAGKMPTRLVASHTPDRCWTENGWRCLQMKFKTAENIEGVKLQPAEWRVFEPPRGGAPTYVLYWHLVEGQTYDYGDRFNNVPDPVLWWKDAVQQALLGSREQYFIRLTSSAPLEDLWTDPGFKEVIQGLGRLGLVAKPSASSGNL
jgi:Protein of unknown function (DUF3485)